MWFVENEYFVKLSKIGFQNFHFLFSKILTLFSKPGISAFLADLLPYPLHQCARMHVAAGLAVVRTVRADFDLRKKSAVRGLFRCGLCGLFRCHFEAI